MTRKSKQNNLKNNLSLICSTQNNINFFGEGKVLMTKIKLLNVCLSKSKPEAQIYLNI